MSIDLCLIPLKVLKDVDSKAYNNSVTKHKIAKVREASCTTALDIVPMENLLDSQC